MRPHFAAFALLAALAAPAHAADTLLPSWPSDLTPVKITPPEAFGPMGKGVWAGPVAYPAMHPGVSCVDCTNVIFVGVLVATPSKVYGTTRMLHAYTSGELPTPAGVTLTRMPAPDGYTESWEEDVTQPNRQTRTIYINADAAGKPTEFATCTLRDAEPAKQNKCILFTALDSAPSVQVNVVFAARMWPERDTIRAQVLRMVDAWRQ